MVLPYALERVIAIDASPDTVFSFFTDPERWAKWWGTGSTIDPHSGGHLLIHHANGVEVTGEVLEADVPKRIVFTYGYTTGPMTGQSRVTIDVEPAGHSTRVRLTHEFEDESARDQHVQGWRHQLALLANVVTDFLHQGAPTRASSPPAACSPPRSARPTNPSFPCNRLLLGWCAVSQTWRGWLEQRAEKRFGRPDSKGHVYRHRRNPWPALPAKAPSCVNEDSHLLITRPVEPHPGSSASHAAVHFGDWNRSPRLPFDLVEQPAGNPRCEGQHDGSVAASAGRNSSVSVPRAHGASK